MNTKSVTMIALAFLVLGLPACKDKAKTETTQKSVVGGTTVEKTTTTETTVDDDGDRTREVETKTTVDPEGMMNKETTTHEETVTEETNP
jgi:hypothetical protein